MEYAQQAHLGGVGKFGYLVEKYRPSVGLFEVSLAGLRRTREGTFFMAEQFRIYCAFRYGTAVHGDVFVVFPGAVGVYDLREELLSHAALSRYEYRKVGRCHAQGYFQSPVHGFAAAYDAETLFYSNKVHAFISLCMKSSNRVYRPVVLSDRKGSMPDIGNFARSGFVLSLSGFARPAECHSASAACSAACPLASISMRMPSLTALMSRLARKP